MNKTEIKLFKIINEFMVEQRAMNKVMTDELERLNKYAHNHRWVKKCTNER